MLDLLMTSIMIVLLIAICGLAYEAKIADFRATTARRRQNRSVSRIDALLHKHAMHVQRVREERGNIFRNYCTCRTCSHSRQRILSLTN